jgi:hypothetical protein
MPTTSPEVNELKTIAAGYGAKIRKRCDEFEELRHLARDLVDRMATDGL